MPHPRRFYCFHTNGGAPTATPTERYLLRFPTEAILTAPQRKYLLPPTEQSLPPTEVTLLPHQRRHLLPHQRRHQYCWPPTEAILPPHQRRHLTETPTEVPTETTEAPTVANVDTLQPHQRRQFRRHTNGGTYCHTNEVLVLHQRRHPTPIQRGRYCHINEAILRYTNVWRQYPTVSLNEVPPHVLPANGVVPHCHTNGGNFTPHQRVECPHAGHHNGRFLTATPTEAPPYFEDTQREAPTATIQRRALLLQRRRALLHQRSGTC
jgi:hypothetical protein